jgi:hypothetical protein
LGWRVNALLGERNLMEQPIQTAIALTVEPVTHAAGAGSFQRCNTGQGGKLGFTKVWPRRSKLGNKGCRCQWTQASDGLERGEPPRDSALELAVELLLLVCQQRQLCGHLPNRLFAVAGKHTLARRGVRETPADQSCLGHPDGPPPVKSGQRCRDGTTYRRKGSRSARRWLSQSHPSDNHAQQDIGLG